MPRDPLDLGALWEKTGGKGLYMTGTINGVAVVCFPNVSDNPKAPQWKVLKARPRLDGSPVPERKPHNLNERTPEEINNAPMPDDGEIPF